MFLNNIFNNNNNVYILEKFLFILSINYNIYIYLFKNKVNK